jgi:hypothetical protein
MATLDPLAAAPATAGVDVDARHPWLDLRDVGLVLRRHIEFLDVASAVAVARQFRFEFLIPALGYGPVGLDPIPLSRATAGRLGVGFRGSLREGCRLALGCTLGRVE